MIETKFPCALIFYGQFWPKIGGAEYQAQKLALALIRNGSHVEVLTPRLEKIWLIKDHRQFDNKPIPIPQSHIQLPGRQRCGLHSSPRFEGSAHRVVISRISMFCTRTSSLHRHQPLARMSTYWVERQVQLQLPIDQRQMAESFRSMADRDVRTTAVDIIKKADRVNWEC